MQKCKNTTKMRDIISILCSCFLMSCNGGSNTPAAATPTSNNSPLAQYKSMLTYTPAGSKNSNAVRAAGDTKQQAFTVPGETTINLLAVRVTLFSSTNCQFGTADAILTMSGGAGVDFPTGVYTSSNASNLALQNRFISESGYNPLNAGSVRFDYQYNAANKGPGWVSADCMANTGIGNYEGTAQACADGSACGFNQPVQQTTALPEEYRRAVIVTAATHNGDFTTGIPALNWYERADLFCMSDQNIPATGAGSRWSAMLNGLGRQYGVTTAQYYYRSDYKTIVATPDQAGGEGFLGDKDRSGFGNYIAISNSPVATEPTQYYTGLGAFCDIYTGCQPRYCSNWSSSSFFMYGFTGDPTSTGAELYDIDEVGVTCNMSLPILCVQQDD